MITVNELVEFIEHKDNVNFVEIERFAEDRGFNAAGEEFMEVPDMNVVFWAEMSPHLTKYHYNSHKDAKDSMVEPISRCT